MKALEGIFQYSHFAVYLSNAYHVLDSAMVRNVILSIYLIVLIGVWSMTKRQKYAWRFYAVLAVVGGL